LSGRVACLMFNFGITHRVGPRRIQVKLARQLAEQGVSSLRFDLSGLGDSRAAAGREDFDEQALVDLRFAIDELQSRAGVREVVIVGLCSGVGHGLHAAVQDGRVAGLLCFDGYAFTGRMARIETRLRRLFRYPAQQLKRWAKVALRLDKGGLLQNGERSRALTADQFRRSMDMLVHRGAAVCLVYSGTVQTRDRRHDQLRALRGSSFLDKVRYLYMPELDHSFTEVAGQATFIEAACSWISEIEARRSFRSPAAQSVEPSSERAESASLLA
jgi:dienelactone hydrolase